VRWETFYTFGEATRYGEDADAPAVQAASCCGPAEVKPVEVAARAAACCGPAAA